MFAHSTIMITFPDASQLLRFPEIEKLDAVLHEIAPTGTFSIAYSGGLDSRFLSFCAKVLGFKATLLHIIGPQIAPDETSGALRDAENLGYEPILVPATSLTLPELAKAGERRCYVCKHHLFETLIDIAQKSECTGPVCDGTNLSDLGVYRPGVEALRELGVFSPLAMAGIAKSRIREIGREVGFPHPEQAARPCLLTRFPYGTTPTREELVAIADAELAVASDPFGSTLRFRIRMPAHGDTRLHIERASLEGRDATHGEVERLVAMLHERFGAALPGLRVEVLEKLSGYYDRLGHPES